ncbi:MAG: nucleotide sugar dehydrogenase [Flexilinea sp.]
MIKTITVFGQGYVGLPLSLSFAIHGCKVIGVDNDPEIYNQLSQGITHQTEKFNQISIREILKEQLQNGSYCVMNDGAAAVRQADTIILTVGIPINQGSPSYDYFDAACRTIGENIQKGSLVLVRSTVIPGTTESRCKSTIETLSGFKVGKDIFLAYVPERIAEGKAFEEFETMPTLIGASDELSLQKAREVIQINSKAEIISSYSITAVETSKVIENLQRDVNIAISQEFARFAEAAGMNIFEVIKLANTHKRVNILTPGPGVGGYCIPNAFHYLNVKAQDFGIDLPLLKLAREENNKLPQFISDKTMELLQNKGKRLSECKIAVAGLAMKDYSPDARLSPAVDVCNCLVEAGASVSAYDNNVSTNYPFKVNSLEEALQGADALLVLNRIYEGFDPVSKISLMGSDPVIIDTKNIIDPTSLPIGTTFWRI